MVFATDVSRACPMACHKATPCAVKTCQFVSPGGQDAYALTHVLGDATLGLRRPAPRHSVGRRVVVQDADAVSGGQRESAGGVSHGQSGIAGGVSCGAHGIGPRRGIMLRDTEYSEAFH